MFSSIWFAVFAQAVLTTVAQPSGRYRYRDGETYFEFLITNNLLERFEYFTPTSYFSASDYPLREVSLDRYVIDFTRSTVGINDWYTGIMPELTNVAIQDGDLTTITFTSDDSCYVMLGGRRRHLTRLTFPATQGTFLYTSTHFPVVMNFTVDTDNSLINMQFSCSGTLVGPETFELVENSDARELEPYGLSPVSAVNAFEDLVRDACPMLCIQQSDLAQVVFSYPTELFIVLGGWRFTFVKDEVL
ncbi:hypothetical protein FOL47_004383 [Perkinsus chesapeaki]|uniref:Uncharacterized protein n=1 Tax=Perkinsus chesapeaki TaxID=330153 RepID=A0A7J6MZT5_PERCH|nr:hypothetical protein FOL47_004383 [Perkinsus chesapeaki]